MHRAITVSKRNRGQFAPKNWTNEGDGLKASSRKTRDVWQDHRGQFSQTIGQRKAGLRNSSDDWNLLTGLPRASMLLLGYAVEMYLKAGIAKAYIDCSGAMFERDIKNYFGHRLTKMACEIAFPLAPSDEENLNKLKKMILVDARYPVFVPEGVSYATTVNQQTSRIWPTKEYEALFSLANRVREHVSKIDSDDSNPCWHHLVDIHKDGYLAFRIGGNLPPRITYRLSTEMKNSNKNEVSDVKALFSEDDIPRLLHYWDCALIYEDGQGKNGGPKTIKRQ